MHSLKACLFRVIAEWHEAPAQRYSRGGATMHTYTGLLYEVWNCACFASLLSTVLNLQITDIRDSRGGATYENSLYGIRCDDDSSTTFSPIEDERARVAPVQSFRADSWWEWRTGKVICTKKRVAASFVSSSWFRDFETKNLLLSCLSKTTNKWKFYVIISIIVISLNPSIFRLRHLCIYTS